MIPGSRVFFFFGGGGERLSKSRVQGPESRVQSPDSKVQGPVQLLGYAMISITISGIPKKLQSNLSLRTPLLRTDRLVPEMPKSYIPYLYNTDTSENRTLGSVPLVSVLKRFDRTNFLSTANFTYPIEYTYRQRLFSQKEVILN